jgi:hypothetical protein
MILVLALLTATLQPAQPSVGDRITITFPAPVVLDASPSYSIVESAGNRVVLQTFAPRPFTVSGTMGVVRFRNMRVPVRSVLKQGDDLQPAPLAPPREVPYPRRPWIAIGAASLVALGAWGFLWWRIRRRKPVVLEPPLSAEDRYRRAVAALLAQPDGRQRWAALATETRAFLAATRPDLGTDLTTTELVPRLGEEAAVVREILRQGDLEKFSPRGAPRRDFDELAARALELAA